MNTQMPEALDAKSRQFALEMFTQSGQQPDQYVRNILQWYKENGFVYTLSPGLLGEIALTNFYFNLDRAFVSIMHRVLPC